MALATVTRPTPPIGSFFGIFVTLRAMRSIAKMPTCFATPTVFLVCDSLKMFRVHATPYTAQVVNHHAVRYLANERFIKQTVQVTVFAIYSCLNVAVRLR